MDPTVRKSARSEGRSCRIDAYRQLSPPIAMPADLPGSHATRAGSGEDWRTGLSAPAMSSNTACNGAADLFDRKRIELIPRARHRAEQRSQSFRVDTAPTRLLLSVSPSAPCLATATHLHTHALFMLHAHGFPPREHAFLRRIAEQTIDLQLLADHAPHSQAGLYQPHELEEHVREWV